MSYFSGRSKGLWLFDLNDKKILVVIFIFLGRRWNEITYIKIFFKLKKFLVRKVIVGIFKEINIDLII